MPVGDVLELKPVIEKYIRELYSGKLTDIRIAGVRKLDFAREWHITVEAVDDAKRYRFEFKVDEETGTVKTFDKSREGPLKERWER